MSSEVQVVAGGADKICQLDYKDLPTGGNRISQLDWTFFARNRPRWQGFHKNDGQRQYQQITAFNFGTSSP